MATTCTDSPTSTSATRTTATTTANNSRYAVWLDRRTQAQQSPQPHHMSPPKNSKNLTLSNDSNNNNNRIDFTSSTHHLSGGNNNNQTNDNNKKRWNFPLSSSSWMKNRQNHGVDENHHDGTGFGIPTMEPSGNEEQEEVWNLVEQNRRERRMEYYRRRIERYYDRHRHPFRKYLVTCFVYMFTYGIDVSVTLLWGCYLIVLCYHKIFPTEDLEEEDTLSVATSHSQATASPPRCYILVMSIVLTIWSLRTITAIVGLKNTDDGSQYDSSDMDHHRHHVRNRCRRCYCCCHRWGLYVTTNIMSPITMVLYMSVLVFVTLIRYNFHPPYLTSQYWIHYSHQYPLYIPSYLLHHVVYPVIDLHDQNSSSSSWFHRNIYAWFVTFMIIMTLLEYVRWKVLASYRIYLIYCDQYYHNNSDDDDDDDDNLYDDEHHISTDQILLMEPLMNKHHRPTIPPSTATTAVPDTYSSEVIRYGIPAWVMEPVRHHHHDGIDDDITFLSSSVMTDLSSSQAIAKGYTKDSSNNNNNNSSSRRSSWHRRWSSFFSMGGGNQGERYHHHHHRRDPNVVRSDHIHGGGTATLISPSSFASIQEEWASRSSEDPHWWTRDD